MAADSNFLTNLGVLGQTPVVPSKKGPVGPSQPDPNFMQNIGAFGSQPVQNPAASAPADQSFMQNLGVFSGGSRPEDPMQMMRREAGRRDVQRGLLDDGSFGFKDVYGRPLVGGKVQGSKEPERQILTPEETRTNENGVVSTGKNLSGGVSTAFVPEYANSSFNDLLAGVNTSGHQPYGSSQLPTTEGSPDAGITPKTQAILAGIQAGKQADMSIDGYKGESYATIQPDDPQFAAAFGQDLADKNTKAKTTGYTKGGRLDQALAGVKTQEANRPMTPERRRAAASMAFYNSDNVMDGLKARDAVNKVVYAGGKHYMSGESGDDTAIGIDRSQARDIASGKTNAQTLLKEHIAKNKDVTKETAAETQDPVVSARDSVKSGFADGAKTDFELNNNQATPQSGVGPVVKPEIVENADLTGEKGKEYLRKLDAGEFF